jgi:hypothetical protein
LVATQIILLSRWFSQKNLIKETNKKNLIKIGKSKSIWSS